MHEIFDLTEVTLAHPGKRYQGQFIDGLIAVFLFFITHHLLSSIEMDASVAGGIKLLVPICYFVFSDALPGGQSLGKKPFGLRVISKTTGKPCKVWQSFMRNAFSPILGIIDAVLILSKQRQRLGDLFANTIVVKDG
ncbi:MAG: RDD family protein [Arenicella sp.]|nr:RDD family protein [Arenicella sp.]